MSADRAIALGRVTRRMARAAPTDWPRRGDARPPAASAPGRTELFAGGGQTRPGPAARTALHDTSPRRKVRFQRPNDDAGARCGSARRDLLAMFFSSNFWDQSGHGGRLPAGRLRAGEESARGTASRRDVRLGPSPPSGRAGAGGGCAGRRATVAPPCAECGRLTVILLPSHGGGEEGARRAQSREAVRSSAPSLP
jgi:hypothetical protein